jgi:hypothetical protein
MAKHYREVMAVLEVGKNTEGKETEWYKYKTFLPAKGSTAEQFLAEMLLEHKLSKQEVQVMMVNAVDLLIRGRVQASLLAGDKKNPSFTIQELSELQSKLSPENFAKFLGGDISVLPRDSGPARKVSEAEGRETQKVYKAQRNESIKVPELDAKQA